MDEAKLEALLTSVAVPLVTADHASLHLVTATPTRVHLHLGGTYAGCPSNSFVERALLAPLVKEVFPNALLEVTSGLPIPTTAKRMGAAG